MTVVRHGFSMTREVIPLIPELFKGQLQLKEMATEGFLEEKTPELNLTC